MVLPGDDTASGGGSGGGGSGGSGVVIIRVSNTHPASFSSGVTYTANTTVSPGNVIYTVTATSTTSETVTFN